MAKYKFTYMNEADTHELATIVVDAPDMEYAWQVLKVARGKYGPIIGQTWRSPIKVQRLPHEDCPQYASRHAPCTNCGGDTVQNPVGKTWWHMMDGSIAGKECNHTP